MILHDDSCELTSLGKNIRPLLIGAIEVASDVNKTKFLRPPEVNKCT